VIKVGRCWLFRRTDVMTWIAARDAEQNGPKCRVTQTRVRPPAASPGGGTNHQRAARSNEILAATDEIAVSAHGTSATMSKIISAELRVLDRIDGGAAS
jgi:hypothetical protein